MCQLLGVSTFTPLRLSFSWDRFALRGSETAGNPDGWGVAYAKSVDVQILREPRPAASSPLVEFLRSYGPESTTIVSHVRRATIGKKQLSNTQPFVRALGGQQHIFAHNGHVSSLSHPTGPWLRPIGTTDSEEMFCLLLDRMEPLWRESDEPELDRRTEIVASFAKEMRGKGAANFLYFDGLTLFAHGHRKTIPGVEVSTGPGLHILIQPEDHGRDPCEGLTTSSHTGTKALVATMPLDGQDWRPLAEGELLRLERGALV